MSKDMDITGLFQVLDPASFPQQLQSRGAGVLVGALDAGGRSGGHQDESVRAARSKGALFVVARGDTAVLSKSYRAADVRDAVHEFANEIVQSFTGRRGVFGSRIVFALTGRGSHEIGSVDMDGGRMAVLTKMGSDSLLPAYSPGGGGGRVHLLPAQQPRSVDRVGGRRARAARVEAAGAEHGRRLVARRTRHRVDAVARRQLRALPDQRRRRPGARAADQQRGDRQLADCFHPTDRRSRSCRTDRARRRSSSCRRRAAPPKRVTFQGKYNQTPRWSPRTDKPQIAFTGRDERGVFDIFVLDVKTGKIDRVTQGKGSNLDPTWSPDGRLIAYTSSRGGIFVNNPETHHEVQIWRGGASSPSWGPAPRR